MKKEIAAGTLLALLFALSLFNVHYICGRTEVLSAQVSEAGRLVDLGRPEMATEVLARSLEDWQQLSDYAHIMLRHDEIDPITDEYLALLDELASGGESTSASFEILIKRFQELAEMEKLKLQSVF